MSAPNASSSSALISFTQDIDYTKTEGFKQFKVLYNHKNTHATHNNPRGAYPWAEDIYQATKGPGCSGRTFDSLSLQDFIKTGAVATCHHLKQLSLALYYTAQMHCCTQKWDKQDDQGPGSDIVNTSPQLVGVMGTGLYHSMANVQMMVSAILVLSESTIIDTFQ